MAEKDPGRIPQTTPGSEPFQIPRKPPAPWAIRLVWLSLAFALVALVALLATCAVQAEPAITSL